MNVSIEFFYRFDGQRDIYGYTHLLLQPSLAKMNKHICKCETSYYLRYDYVNISLRVLWFTNLSLLYLTSIHFRINVHSSDLVLSVFNQLIYVGKNFN